jgi:hypothetical protein
VEIVCPRFRDDVNDPSRGSAVLSIRTRGDDLKFFDRIKRNIDRSTLAARLLAEEAVVVIAAVEADIVEDTPLAGEIDLVTVPGPV